MFRFSLFGYPITVHWMFWLMAAFVSGATYARGQAQWKFVLLNMAVVFVSILVHEFGHATFQRKFGGNPRITLWGMGGYAQSDRQPTRNEALWIISMGPAFGLLLGLAALIWYRGMGPETSILTRSVVGFAIFVNIGWSILNLLPIYPLDGGQLLGAIMHGGRPVLRFRIGMVVSGLVGALFLYAGQLWGAALFGYLAFQNHQRSKGLPTQGLFG